MSFTILSESTMHTAASPVTRSDSPTYRQVLEDLQRDVPASEVVLLSALPRGGMFTVLPQRLSENYAKAYNRQWQQQDSASWDALATGKVVVSDPASPFVSEFLAGFSLAHSVSAPVSDPVLSGYAGVLQVQRRADQPAFTAADRARIGEAAESVGQTLERARSSRGVVSDTPAWLHVPAVRQFALDGHGKSLLFAEVLDVLDERVREKVVAEARHRATAGDTDGVVSTRLVVPDGYGDHVTLNAVRYSSYPALADGPVIFFCFLPTGPEWGALRSVDLQADPELARLVPSLKFMQQEYHRGPTLHEIARTVHLSPFHFHRRFTELLGLTPKHFLLECQIFDAKQQLMSGVKELSKIASDCGFAHQSHFTSRFKQATGLTPTRWRRMALARFNGDE